ncbi:MAG: 4a-hydroxytetrahydrobiopterin dehydratase [Pyrinomonadaceae bacterium]|nr:4a-hydroxytetrahydrobiopterin dehydratase [Pyrinomonadaceae bacterium]
MERKLLSAEEVTAALSALDGWRVDGNSLKRRFEFENFAGALVMVNRIGEIAEEIDHHPDITFGWGYAEILTTTHDRGGVTPFDIELAARINAAAG